MRIVMLVHQVVGRSGGGERFAIGLSGELAKRGNAVTLCVTRNIERPFRSKLESGGVDVMELGRRSRLQVRAFSPLRELLATGEVDVLHAHMFGSNVWGALFGRLHRIPAVVAHEQTWSYSRGYHRKALDFLIGRIVDAFVAVSSADAERMERLEHIPAEKIVVIPNAYVPRGGDLGGDLRAELGLDPRTPLIGSVAQLRPQKTLEVMIEALSLIDTEPRPHLAIAGDGECREGLAAFANELGVAERVHLLGVREDVESVISAFDVSALSSDYEGTPLFVVESMSMGTPVVATRVGGLPDQIDDGEEGLLTPPGDAAALADALGSLLSDAPRRERMAGRARERAREWSIERTADRFEDLYRSVLARKRSGAQPAQP